MSSRSRLPLTEPALRPEEPQVEVKPELVPELLAPIVGQLAADPFAAHLDQDADLADGLRARCTELFEHRDLLLDGPLIILRALRPVAQVRLRRQRQLRIRRASRADAEREGRDTVENFHAGSSAS